MFSGPPTPTMARKGKDARSEQIFDYFLILDFEATCDKGKQPKPQEIIEFPVLKMNARTLDVESAFHQYVSPTEYPELTEFCTELTGITQEMVTNQPNLRQTLGILDEWLRKENLAISGKENCPSSPKKSFIFVTCGDWDLKKMLPGQCKESYHS